MIHRIHDHYRDHPRWIKQSHALVLLSRWVLQLNLIVQFYDHRQTWPWWKWWTGVCSSKPAKASWCCMKGTKDHAANTAITKETEYWMNWPNWYFDFSLIFYQSPLEDSVWMSCWKPNVIKEVSDDIQHSFSVWQWFAGEVRLHS